MQFCGCKSKPVFINTARHHVMVVTGSRKCIPMMIFCNTLSLLAPILHVEMCFYVTVLSP
jgi:hypothetical protein